MSSSEEEVFHADPYAAEKKALRKRLYEKFLPYGQPNPVSIQVQGAKVTLHFESPYLLHQQQFVEEVDSSEEEMETISNTTYQVLYREAQAALDKLKRTDFPSPLPPFPRAAPPTAPRKFEHKPSSPIQLRDTRVSRQLVFDGLDKPKQKRPRQVAKKTTQPPAKPQLVEKCRLVCCMKPNSDL